MTAEKFFFITADLDSEQQTAFFQALEKSLTAQEINALKIGVGYFRLLKNKELHDTMCKEIAEAIYKEFTA